MNDTLFEPPEPDPPRGGGRAAAPAGAPLAARLRPAALAEVVGQEHLLGPDSPLRRAIEDGQPHSMILFGPPGTGKTTLARIVAEAADAAWDELSVVQAGRAEVREVLARAEQRRRNGTATVFFLDEIHRFNKAQQDALLPAVEDGLVVLIGATTENPYFEVNAALISRCAVYELEALTPEDVRAILERAAVPADPPALDFLADRSGGDARTALSALEIAAGLGAEGEPVTLAHAEEALQKRAIRYDRKADQHYDTISAWIKSTRASDPDASLYYLAVMLEGGEDPRFIARRAIILASEDIGMADPSALSIAVAAARAVEHVGLPEAQFALAQAAIHLSLAPKSDGAKRAIGAARRHVREVGAQLPPGPLRTGGYPAADGLGRGVGYDSPHEHPGHLSGQELLPDRVVGATFYTPDDAEPDARARLEEIRRRRGTLRSSGA